MSDANDKTSLATAKEERREALASHSADHAPTADEAEAADRSRQQFVDDAGQVAEHERAAAERGAKVKGEGDIV